MGELVSRRIRLLASTFRTFAVLAKVFLSRKDKLGLDSLAVPKEVRKYPFKKRGHRSASIFSRVDLVLDGLVDKYGTTRGAPRMSNPSLELNTTRLLGFLKGLRMSPKDG